MPRPKIKRFVEIEPNVTYFKPRGIPLRYLQEVSLTMDEVEALRLRFLENLNQIEASKKMQVSRQTFGRILQSACSKIADALLNGKAIRIEKRIF